MSHPSHPRYRLAVVLVALAAILPFTSPIAAVAQDISCDDLTSRRAAQALLDHNPSLWDDALDPDANERACDHEEDREPPSSLAEEDVDAYLEAVYTHASELAFNITPLMGIVQEITLGTVTARDQEKAEEIVALFSDAPEVAADLTVPTGYDHVQEVYADAAGAYAALADAFVTWSESRPGTTENTEALAELTDRVGEVSALNIDLFTILDEEGL